MIRTTESNSTNTSHTSSPYLPHQDPSPSTEVLSPPGSVSAPQLTKLMNLTPSSAGSAESAVLPSLSTTKSSHVDQHQQHEVPALIQADLNSNYQAAQQAAAVQAAISTASSTSINSHHHNSHHHPHQQIIHSSHHNALSGGSNALQQHSLPTASPHQGGHHSAAEVIDVY